MRQIFDPETEKQVSFISARSLNDSQDQNEYQANELYDESKRESVYSTDPEIVLQ